MVTEFKKRNELVFTNYAEWCTKHKEALEELAKEDLTDKELDARLSELN